MIHWYWAYDGRKRGAFLGPVDLDEVASAAMRRMDFILIRMSNGEAE